MKQGIRIACVLAFALLARQALAEQGESPTVARDVVAFHMAVRVDVDASGKPVNVEAPERFPEAIRSFVEQQVRSWRYEPARQDGVAVPATTYVRVGACATPDDLTDDYRFALELKGNGPGLMTPTGTLLPPRYPPDAMMRGIEGSFDVKYSVTADGVELRGIEGTDREGKRNIKLFTVALEEWVESLPYRPEMVDGQAIATDMDVEVAFQLVLDGREQLVQQEQQRIAGADECKLASSRSMGLTPVANNSPIRVSMDPAG